MQGEVEVGHEELRGEQTNTKQVSRDPSVELGALSGESVGGPEGAPHLEERVTGGQVSQGGDGKDLPEQVGPQQVGEELVAVEVGVAHPRLRQQPVPLVITRQEDGAAGSWRLAELWDTTPWFRSIATLPMAGFGVGHPYLDGDGAQEPVGALVEQAERGCHVLLASINGVGWDVLQHLVVHNEDPTFLQLLAQVSATSQRASDHLWSHWEFGWQRGAAMDDDGVVAVEELGTEEIIFLPVLGHVLGD